MEEDEDMEEDDEEDEEEDEEVSEDELGTSLVVGGGGWLIVVSPPPPPPEDTVGVPCTWDEGADIQVVMDKGESPGSVRPDFVFIKHNEIWTCSHAPRVRPDKR